MTSSPAKRYLFRLLRLGFRALPLPTATRDRLRQRFLERFVEPRVEPLPSPLPATLVAFDLPQFHPNDAWWGEGQPAHKPAAQP